MAVLSSDTTVGGVSVLPILNNAASLTGVKDATTSQKGIVQLVNSVTNTSTAYAATAAAVCAAYSLASGKLDLRSITDITSSTSTSFSASTNLLTMNTLRYMVNRTSGFAASNASYSTYMGRGIALVTSTPSSMNNGTVAFVYSA